MKWKCNRCGFESVSFAGTEPEDMPICTQFYSGDAPRPPLPETVTEDERRVFNNYDYQTGGRLCGGFPQKI
jgi:hypothetical protein